jgi:genome maintenance exonuclease 1
MALARKQFNLDFVELPKIKRVQVDGKRHYQLADGECVPYPSVTTILSGCKKSKKALHEWRRRVGAETANKISKQASERGTSVHQLIEDYCQNKESEGKIMPNAADMFTRLRDVANESIDNIKLVEGLMYSEYLRTAGTVDMVAEFNGKLSVIDWKTSTRRKTRSRCYNYFKQEAAYAVMYEEMTGQPITQLVTVVTDQEGGSQVFVEHRDEWIGEFIVLRDQYEEENREV